MIDSYCYFDLVVFFNDWIDELLWVKKVGVMWLLVLGIQLG